MAMNPSVSNVRDRVRVLVSAVSSLNTYFKPPLHHLWVTFSVAQRVQKSVATPNPVPFVFDYVLALRLLALCLAALSMVVHKVCGGHGCSGM